MVIHAGGRPVYADRDDGHQPPEAVTGVTLEDDGKRAVLTCRGAADSGFTSQTLLLRSSRPADPDPRHRHRTGVVVLREPGAAGKHPALGRWDDAGGEDGDARLGGPERVSR